jgi:hypothetical protein
MYKKKGFCYNLKSSSFIISNTVFRTRLILTVSAKFLGKCTLTGANSTPHVERMSRRVSSVCLHHVLIPMTAPHVGAKRALAGAADGAVRAHQHRVNVQMPRADVFANVVLLAHIVAGWTMF